MYRILLLALVTSVLSVQSNGQSSFYVSAAGNDQNPGTQQSPFASLEKARDALRQLRKDGKLSTSATVTIVGDLSLTSAFELTDADSGSDDQPITFRGDASTPARVLGGKVIHRFTPVKDKSVLGSVDPAAKTHIMQADLKSQGVTDFGELKVRGMRNQAETPLELFFDGKPMQLAQYPNTGWLTISGTPGGQEGDRVTCESKRISRWANAKAAWAYGYWCYGWADFYLPVQSVNPDAKEIQLGVKPYYGLAAKQRFRMLNMLEELDQPGEWYLDRESGILYFWPPSPITPGKAVVSVLQAPLLSITGAKNIRIENLTFEGCRGSGISVKDSSRVVIAGCTIGNVGSNGVNIGGGSENQVVSCDIHDCGEGGIAISGGDRNTLTPSNHQAINNHIFRIGRIYHTYRPGILLDGVGNRAANNLIEDCPHQGIAFGGNDHLMEFNEIHHVMLETDDAGAIYCGRDWTKRGTVIRNNYIHHSGPNYAPPVKTTDDPSLATKPLDVGGVIAIYLDDLHSGSTIENNIVQSTTISVLLGGGRDNIVRNNIMLDAKWGVWLDARGLTWAKADCSPGGSHRMYELLDEVHHDRPPYSERYPALVSLLKDDPQCPKGNIIDRNIVINVETAAHANDDIAKPLLKVEHMLVLTEPESDDPLRVIGKIKTAQLQSIGFESITTDKIGLFKDSFRTSMPRKGR